ncbi:hypothetical protein KFU94_48795 [Chloroflexi bacterium TSY]|nr:hypothetical protein [Chloroflexi bacterium TSY]
MRGVTIAVHFEYDADGRLSTMTLPGSDRPIRYTRDEQGRPQTVALDQRILARFGYDDATKTTTVALDNGTTTTTEANAADGRPTRHMVCRGEERLLARTLCYNDIGEIVSDGERHYGYDGLGRLISAQNEDDYQSYRFAHDNMDNLVMRSDSDKTVHVGYDTAGRLVAATTDEGTQTHFTHDRWGRLTQCVGPEGVKHYRYDDAGQLQEVRHDHALVARFRYDHKGRLVWAEVEGEIERYLYDDADELLAVTNAYGQPRRLLIRTPLGVLAQSSGHVETEAILFRHDDERGTTRLLTDRQGEIVARFAYDPFGRPIATSQASQGDTVQQMPCLTNRNWYAAIGLYYFGARWYDPVLGRFLTPDSYTGAPDDARLLNPLYLASRQPALRCQILNEWLKQPRVRNAYAFCGNDPVGRVDPTGHWSFGGVLLMLLGAIWTLPNTLFGILVEITCLVGEVILAGLAL